MNESAIAKAIECKGKFCKKTATNVIAVIKKDRQGFYLEMPCPCCHHGTNIRIPNAEKSRNYILKTGFIGNDDYCSHCGLLTSKLCHKQAELMLCPENGRIVEGLKIVVDEISVVTGC